MADDSIGKRIGNYRLVEKLACGAFGCVYKAQHIYFDERIVAVKLLHTYLVTKQEQDSFIHEAKLLEKLKHPYILPIIDIVIDNGLPYLVTEYVPHGTLHNRLKRYATDPVSQEEALSILAQIGKALQFAHDNNIVHRDLKPENILFNAHDDAVLADFGIATVLNTGTKLVGSAGTPAYMAPEQFEKLVSFKSDQYALGCIAYELFTGQKPFDVDNVSPEAVWFQHSKVEPTAPTQLNSNLPLYIEQAILKAMAKDRKDRHDTIKDFIVALQKTAQKCFEEGKVAYDAGEFTKALAAYEKATELNPQFMWAWHDKGHVFKKLGHYPEALKAFDQACEIDETNTWPWAEKGQILRDLQRCEEALTAFNRAIQCDENNGWAWHGKGCTLRDLKRYEESLTCFERTTTLLPEFVWGWFDKGDMLQKLGRNNGEALEAYNKAIVLDAKNKHAWHNKAFVLEQLAQEAHEKAQGLGYQA